MDACTIAGESTDAIVMDESPADERDIREACQRCVLFLFLDCFLLGDRVFILLLYPCCPFQLCTPGRCFVHQTLSFTDKSSLVMVSIGLVELVPKHNISIL